MIKADIIKKIVKKHGVTVRQAIAILQTVLNEILAGLVKGEAVELRRFGVFKTKKQKPRTIILPIDGKPFKRPAQTIVLFEPSSTVKTALNKTKKVKAKNPLDILIEEAIRQHKEGKTINIRKFAKKHNIKLPK